MITVLTGHLTPTNKRHLEIMLSKGINEGTLNRITYYIEKTEGIYKVRVITKDKSIIFGPPIRVETATFKHK